MTKKLSANIQTITIAVTVRPNQEKFATRRAQQVGMSRSAYIQKLIELDEAKDVLAEALTLNIKPA